MVAGVNASIGWLGRAIFTVPRAPRLGDWVFINHRNQLGHRTVDQTSFSDIWFPYAPFNGAAQVTQVNGGKTFVQFWGESYPIEKAPRPLRPLRGWVSWLCRRRLGEWIFAREMGENNALSQTARAPTRSDLPLVNALGGSYRSWSAFWARQMAKVFLYRFARLPLPRPWNGTGIQVWGARAQMAFTYRGQPRQFRLQTLRLHSNGNYLCLGQILPSGEARTFNLDGISDLSIAGFGPMDPYHLRIELWALTMTLYAYAKQVTPHRAHAGLPPPPIPNFADLLLGRAVEHLAALHRWIARRWAPLHMMHLRWQGGFYPPVWVILRRMWPLRRWAYWRAGVSEFFEWHLAEWRGHPAPKVDVRRQDARWRRRLRVFADILETGQSVAPRALLNCTVICKDTLFARAVLRAIMVKVADECPMNTPQRSDIERCLALSPPQRNYLKRREIEAGNALEDILCESYRITFGYQWDSIRKQADDPVGRIIIAHIFAVYFTDYISIYGVTSPQVQDVSPTDFLVVMFYFAANWQGDIGQFDHTCAAKLRWLADFSLHQK